MYAAPLAVLRALPPKKNLTSGCPPVYDQGELGSRTANAIGAAHHFEQIKQNAKKAFTPSRLFIYYNERAIEGTVNGDSEAMIRVGIKSVVKQGVCPEDLPGAPCGGRRGGSAAAPALCLPPKRMGFSLCLFRCSSNLPFVNA
jgi:C1A family cysteine protease